MRPLFYSAMLLTLAACAGSQKGADAGWGFDALNTQSKEEKEEEAWFDSFYGKNHCHGQWAGDCKLGASGEGGGLWGSSKGFWGGSADADAGN